MIINKSISKKAVSIGLALLILFTIQGSFWLSFAKAEENTSDAILISSEEDLLELAANCKNDSYSRGITVKLTTDIEVTSSDFKGIPYFAGTFDGGHHTIRNINIDYKGSDFGFFRYLSDDAFVMNLTISGNINVTGTQENIGGIAGVNYGIISNSSFVGKVNGNTATGAIVGLNKANAKIVSCTSDADVSATDQTGGIAGKNEGLISECTSKSRVNIQELSSSLDIGGVDVGTFNITQNVVDRNDMGGIAGESTGIIANCTNYGTVGFNHTGYNVGGIAGKQSGKIYNCTNEGEVYGRKDVGGIVGQAEPYIESEYLNDRVDQVQDSVNSISNTLNNLATSVDNASSEARSYTESLTNQYKADVDVLSDSLNDLSDSVQENNPNTKEYFDNINDALNKIKDIQDGDTILSDAQKDAIDEQWQIINDNLTNISNAMADTSDSAEDFVKSMADQIGTGNTANDIQGLVDVVDGQLHTISNSIDSISSQINNISDVVSDTMDIVTSDEDYIEDISAADNADTDGVISGSVNRGSVNGDLNVGGIAGTMNIEYDVDPEFDIDLSTSTNVKLRSTVNDVVINCINYGDIISKKNSAGGITGLQELGLIYGSEGYGSVKSDTGDYAGGIAGNSVSAISNSYSLCNIESSNYTGGIAGQGYTVKNCIAIPVISGDGEAKGSVAGITSSEGDVNNNIFVNESTGGIDNINYKGVAEQVSYDYVMSLDNIPEGFNQVTITFKADDKVLSTKVIAYNASLSEKDLPYIPSKEGCYAQWPSDIVQTPITQNKVVEAEYNLWTESIAGNNNTSDGKPLFLIEGRFYDDDEMIMDKCDISGLHGNIEYAYSWNLEGSHIKAVTTVIGHFYITDTSGSSEVWYKNKDNNEWVKASSKKNGSYLTAEIPYEADFAVIHKNASNTIYYIIAAVAVVVVIAVVVIRKKTKKKIKS